MDGVMRLYMNDSSSTANAEADRTSPAGLQDSAAASLSAAADTSPSDRRASTTATDSNANIVLSDMQSVPACPMTVNTVELNANTDEAPSDVEKQTITWSSAQSCPVIDQSCDNGYGQSAVWTAGDRCRDIEKTGLSDSQLSFSATDVQVSSVMKENPESGHDTHNVPDSCSCDEALSSSSQTSSLPVNRQSAMTVDVTPVHVVKSQSITASENLSTSIKSPSSDLLNCSAGDVTSNDDCDVVSCEQGNSSPASAVPVVSLSCSSLVDKLCSYVPSRGPLAQMYGGNDVVQVTSSSDVVSQTLTSSSTWNSLLTYSPLKVGGDVSQITAKISAARSCSRNGLIRPTAANDVSFHRRADSFRSALRAGDFRSTPWLAASERSMENLRPPSLVLAHSASVSGSLTDRSSLVLSSSINSSPSMTPLASRCSSSLSNDSTTLRTSTLVPDSSRMFITFLMLQFVYRSIQFLLNQLNQPSSMELLRVKLSR